LHDECIVTACLFLDGFVQHDDNTFMDDGACGIAHPVGDTQMTNAGHMFIYLPYCILPHWFQFSMQLIVFVMCIYITRGGTTGAWSKYGT
jgi:hypothetical protein